MGSIITAGIKMSEMVTLECRGLRMNIHTGRHEVLTKLTAGRFAIGKAPVNYEQYAEYLERIGAIIPMEFKDPAKSKDPVLVQKDDAEQYCNFVAAQTGMEVGLPDEISWHFAVWGRESLIVDVKWDPKILQYEMLGRSREITDVDFSDRPNYLEWTADEHKLMRSDETVRILRGSFSVLVRDNKSSLEYQYQAYRKEVSSNLDEDTIAFFRLFVRMQ
jgi:hypothetical protein